MLKLLMIELQKIKRQKFIAFTIISACLVPIPLTAIIVRAKLSFNKLFMFVIEFGFFLVLPLILGIIMIILLHMESENETLKTLDVIPVSRIKLLAVKILLSLVLAVFYSVAAVGSTIVGGLLEGSVTDVISKITTALSFGILTALATLPVVILAVVFYKNYILPVFFTAIYVIGSFILSLTMSNIPSPLTLLFRYCLPIMTASPELLDAESKVSEWIIPFCPCFIILLTIGIISILLSGTIYKKQEV